LATMHLFVDLLLSIPMTATLMWFIFIVVTTNLMWFIFIIVTTNLMWSKSNPIVAALMLD
jgi:hypothetical protein